MEPPPKRHVVAGRVRTNSLLDKDPLLPMSTEVRVRNHMSIPPSGDRDPTGTGPEHWNGHIAHPPLDNAYCLDEHHRISRTQPNSVHSASNYDNLPLSQAVHNNHVPLTRPQRQQPPSSRDGGTACNQKTMNSHTFSDTSGTIPAGRGKLPGETEDIVYYPFIKAKPRSVKLIANDAKPSQKIPKPEAQSQGISSASNLIWDEAAKENAKDDGCLVGNAESKSLLQNHVEPPISHNYNCHTDSANETVTTRELVGDCRCSTDQDALESVRLRRSIVAQRGDSMPQYTSTSVSSEIPEHPQCIAANGFRGYYKRLRNLKGDTTTSNHPFFQVYTLLQWMGFHAMAQLKFPTILLPDLKSLKHNDVNNYSNDCSQDSGNAPTANGLVSNNTHKRHINDTTRTEPVADQRSSSDCCRTFRGIMKPQSLELKRPLVRKNTRDRLFPGESTFCPEAGVKGRSNSSTPLSLTVVQRCKLALRKNRYRFVSFLCNLAYKSLTLVLIATNFGFFSLNVYVTHIMRTHYGMMHAYTMTSVITGLLPLHNSVNMILFWLGLLDHSALIRELNTAFVRSRFKTSDALWLRGAQRKLFFIFFLATGIPLIARLVQCGMLPDLFTQWHGPVSLFIVPLLRGWQIVPLLYFWLLCATLRMRFSCLRLSIAKDPSCHTYSVESHFEQFRLLINVSQRLTNFLSSFIFASLVFAVLSLCLTVYFLTNAKELINLKAEMPLKYRINNYFDYGWGVLQVIVAISYAICICKFGWTVNEEARAVIKSALCMKPRTDDDRFQILRFQQMLFSQMSWGISVWKAFLIERSFLFTMTSTIVAYALVLLRLKASVGSSAAQHVNITSGS